MLLEVLALEGFENILGALTGVIFGIGERVSGMRISIFRGILSWINIYIPETLM